MTEPTSQKRRARRARFQGAALLAAVLAVTLIRAEDLRFLHSSGDMEAIARTLEEGVALRSQSIGSLSFTHVWRENTMVYFHRGADPEGDGHGYVWSPGGRPSDTRHLRGAWYRFRDDAHQ